MILPVCSPYPWKSPASPIQGLGQVYAAADQPQLGASCKRNGQGIQTHTHEGEDLSKLPICVGPLYLIPGLWQGSALHARARAARDPEDEGRTICARPHGRSCAFGGVGRGSMGQLLNQSLLPLSPSVAEAKGHVHCLVSWTAWGPKALRSFCSSAPSCATEASTQKHCACGGFMKGLRMVMPRGPVSLFGEDRTQRLGMGAVQRLADVEL